MINNILEYLEEASACVPNKTAIFESDGRHISFRNLENLSKKIAGYIFSHNIQGSAVGVVATQSIETIALYFGVIYSGNYFVPIDASSPKDRIQSIISNSECKLILSPIKLDMDLGVEVETFEQIQNSSEFKVKRKLLGSVRANHTSLDPLYIIYTSGSTGVPKGVIKNHNSMISFIESFVQTFELEDVVMANQSPFYFDASFKDVFLFIKLKAELNLCSKDMFMFPVKLVEFLNARKVNYICFVPSALNILSSLNVLKDLKLPYLKFVFFVGEIMPAKHLNYLLSHIEGARFVNLYGSSEMAGVCCYYEVKHPIKDNEVLPIGKPLCNMKVELYEDDKKIIMGGGILVRFV